MASESSQQAGGMSHELQALRHELALTQQTLQHVAQVQQQQSQQQDLLRQQLQQNQRLSVKVPKPPTTNGKAPSPSHFAEAFEVYANHCRLDLTTPEAVLEAAPYLRDQALDWYYQHQHEVAAGTAGSPMELGSMQHQQQQPQQHPQQRPSAAPCSQQQQ
jgi:hypothetical protein